MEKSTYHCLHHQRPLSPEFPDDLEHVHGAFQFDPLDGRAYRAERSRPTAPVTGLAE